MRNKRLLNINQAGKIVGNSILKDMFYKFTQIYLVRLLK